MFIAIKMVYIGKIYNRNSNIELSIFFIKNVK